MYLNIKLLITIGIALLFSNALLAQNFGIGDDTPDAMLDVQGESRISMGAYFILGLSDASRDWGMRAISNFFSLTEPKQADKEYLRIVDDGDITIKPNGLTTMTLVGATQNVGIGTTIPAQKLEVNGIVRLIPETHIGSDMNRLVMVDNTGDIRANDLPSLATNDGVTFDISGRVIKPGTSSAFDLPGPLVGYTTTSKFIIYTTCNVSAIPIVIDFKRYSTDLQFAIAYTIGSGTLVNSNASSVSFSYDFGCGINTMTIVLNTTTNALTFSMTGGTSSGLYIQSGRTSLFKWL